MTASDSSSWNTCPSKSLADLYHEQNGPMDPIKLLPILIQTDAACSSHIPMA